MNDYIITYRSVGAGLQTWECTALCEADAIDQFVECNRKYNGNCYGKDSIASVVKKVCHR
jgi:hypothetical protein